jgi:hypothetical protein
VNQLDAVRAAAMVLPEVVEEDAWIGVRWRVRGRTFAHVLDIAAGQPPAYAKAFSVEEARVLMFRAEGDELVALRAMHVAPPWRQDEVGVVLDVSGGLDDGEVAELVAESWRCRAPKRSRP